MEGRRYLWIGDKMGRLDGCVAYLCGPIDHADDDGVGWRRVLSAQLAEKYGMKVLDPTDKPFKSHTHNFEEIGDEKVNALRLRDEKKFDVLASKMREIVRADLRCVDLSDILIAYIPKDTHLCGTIHEIVVASESKKPTLLVVEGGRENASNWFWGMLPTSPDEDGRSGWIFDGWDAFFTYMDEIDNVEQEFPEPKASRWVILDVGSR